jgi:hypothetical protein
MKGSHGGKRVPGEGKKLGSTSAERLAKNGAQGARIVASFFCIDSRASSASLASASETVGHVRIREPGGTPNKQEVTRVKADEQGGELTGEKVRRSGASHVPRPRGSDASTSGPLISTSTGLR